MKRTPVLTVSLVLLAICGFGSASAQQVESIADKRITMTCTNVAPGTVFRELMVKYPIHFGFEESELDRQRDIMFDIVLDPKLIPDAAKNR